MPASFVGETGEIPTLHTLRVRHAAEATAATDFHEALGAAPVQGNVTAVKFIPDTAFSGINTTTPTLYINNETQTLVPASQGFPLNTNLVAFTPLSLTLGAAAAVAVNAGDVLSFNKSHLSTGASLPAGTIEVIITRADTL